MDRKDIFTVGECYHIFNRGVDKKAIFRTDGDRKHLQRLLYTRNSDKRIDSERVKGLPLHAIARGEPITEIIAYCFMPNHIHLILRESSEGGISAFMGKLGTAFSMYMNMNIRHHRTGPLMCRPFRSKHIDSDEYFRWVFSYVHLNPVELVQADFKEKGMGDFAKVKGFLEQYPYSSYIDHLVGAREETAILAEDKEAKALLRDSNSLRSLLSAYQTSV